MCWHQPRIVGAIPDHMPAPAHADAAFVVARRRLCDQDGCPVLRRCFNRPPPLSRHRVAGHGKKGGEGSANLSQCFYSADACLRFLAVDRSPRDRKLVLQLSQFPLTQARQSRLLSIVCRHRAAGLVGESATQPFHQVLRPIRLAISGHSLASRSIRNSVSRTRSRYRCTCCCAVHRHWRYQIKSHSRHFAFDIGFP